MSVGQELLDVPFPDMVTNLALGIAKAQKALDENSVQTAEALSTKTVKIVPLVIEKINAEGKPEFPKPETVEMSLLQVGLNPTFYQFSESVIEVTMDIKTSTTEETDVKTTTNASVGFLCWSASIKVEADFNRKFGKEVHGTSKLMVKLTPVPPPPGLMPKIEVINEKEKPPAP
jgi:hypothetical protein